MPLTPADVSKAAPNSQPYKLADEKGLVLEIRPTGAKFWKLRYRLVASRRSWRWAPIRRCLYPRPDKSAMRPGRSSKRGLIPDPRADWYVWARRWRSCVSFREKSGLPWQARTKARSMAEAIDYFNDELLLTAGEKPKAARTPLLDRAVEILERINGFVDEAGSEPVSEPGRSVRERMLANELAGLRASKGDLDGLASYDTRNLVFGVANDADPLDDPLLSAGLDIFEVRDELKPMARPDFVADRRPCPDFERFDPLFERVRKDVWEERRRPQPFRQERVELSEFFVLKGQLVHVADLRDEHRRNGKPDARLRVIFDNGTESNLLMSSLVRRLYEDKDARRIGTTDVGPLFEGARTGFVYVLRSRSDKPEAQGLLKVGTTSGTVEDRIARAETQSTFLFAPVEILETY